MTRITLMAALLATTLSGSISAQATEVGVMNFSFDAPNRERLVQALVTYPVEVGGYPEWTGDNPVFKGVRLLRDAKPERKKHPLIILSHGSGGNAANLSWLSKTLAENGFVVVAPNHQGSTSADSRPETTIPATWERKQDMASLLDAVTYSPALQRVVDLNDVTAVGFSLGGQTVLGLVGTQLNAKALADNCDSKTPTPGCEWLNQGNSLIKGHVDLHRIDADKFNGRIVEPRVKRVVAIDPGFGVAYEQQSLKEISVPVLLINLGAKGEVPLGIEAESLAKVIPHATFKRVDSANHFAFLPECKWMGGLLIWMEGDDPVCPETSAKSRAEVHDEVARSILAFLQSPKVN